jgi:hypothetical protein
LILLAFFLHLPCARELPIKFTILQQLRNMSTPEENTMASVTVDSKQFIKEYFNAMISHPRTEDLINQYVSDPGLKEHIRRSEAAFPGYGLI